MSALHEPFVCLGAAKCMALTLQALLLTKVSWRDALPGNVSIMRGGHWKFAAPEDFCNQKDVRSALQRSVKHPKESWSMADAVQSVRLLKGDLDFQTDAVEPSERHILGWVPNLLPNGLDVRHGWRTQPGTNGRVYLPGSTSRGEDAAVLRSFFSDFETGEPLRNGVFLEIGGFDGFKESNT